MVLHLRTRPHRPVHRTKCRKAAFQFSKPIKSWNEPLFGYHVLFSEYLVVVLKDRGKIDYRPARVLPKRKIKILASMGNQRITSNV